MKIRDEWFDGDLFFITDNKVILENTRPLPAIECVQRRAEKKIVTTEDLVESNKGSFGDTIGSTTNRITAQIERQAGFEKGSDEYKALEYRIMCGQHYQQCSIDRAKGIIAKPMPSYWYSQQLNIEKEDDDEETKAIKAFNKRICADKKPYFMIYRYPDLMREYKSYMKTERSVCLMNWGMKLEDLLYSTDKTPEQEEFVEWYYKKMPVGTNSCISNKICWKIEKEFDGFVKSNPPEVEFDYTILKNDAAYTSSEYSAVKKVYQEFIEQAHQRMIEKGEIISSYDKEEFADVYEVCVDKFKEQCTRICPNEDALCNIVLDLCYKSNTSKQFAWTVCGDVIIRHLLEANDYTISVPIKDDNGDIEYCGERFSMQKIKLEGEFEDGFCDE